jgi:hypothetical protein
MCTYLLAITIRLECLNGGLDNHVVLKDHVLETGLLIRVNDAIAEKAGGSQEGNGVPNDSRFSTPPPT